jgi:hypothetical protein
LRQRAVAEIVDRLERAGATVVPHGDSQRVLEFAGTAMVA